MVLSGSCVLFLVNSCSLIRHVYICSSLCVGLGGHISVALSVSDLEAISVALFVSDSGLYLV